ncbi:MAG: PHP domain-containing protein [Ruminiclostridium sp.]|nr:PHP domain-containing protein [Ruminiclostridium sp.]
MNEDYLKLIDELNSSDAEIRLDSLRKLMNMVNAGEIQRPVNGGYVNNHIHTTYSFSPYSPTRALWMAYNSGLITAGIVDHDSVSGAEEFIQAGKITGMAATVGTECRVDFSGTPLAGKRINHPDQRSVAYVAIHGIPHNRIEDVKKFFQPYLIERNKRNELMLGKIGKLVANAGIKLDFEKDVKPLSMYKEGGSITERHILYALSLKLVDKFGKGSGLLEYLKNCLKLNIDAKIQNMLLDPQNPYYGYDLLGLLKAEMVEDFYIDAKAECPDVKDFIELTGSIGAISAYAYLGDIGDSVTGDKKSQKFEDDYIDELFELLKKLGFNGVTYMPSRNTIKQLKRVKTLCDRHELFQISGEDINSPRQSFVCKAMENKEFDNLIDSTWALIGHEKAATEDKAKGMFAPGTVAAYPELQARIRVFKEIGLKQSS